MLEVSRFLYERPMLHQWLIQHINQNAQLLQGRWVWVSPDPTRMYPVLCRIRPITPQGTFTVQDEETQEIFNIHTEDILAVLQQQSAQPPAQPRIDRGFYTKQTKVKLSLEMLADFTTYWDLLEQSAKNQSVPVESQVVERAHAYFALQDEIDQLRYELGEEDPDQIAKQKFLRSLGYLTDEDTLTLKGRIAREIHSTHPVLLTELLLHAVFKTASPAVAGTILSSFTVPRKSSSSSSAFSSSSQSQVRTSFPVETMEEIRAVVKDKTAHCIHMEEEAGIQSKETELWYDTFTTEYEPFFWQWMQPDTTFCEWVKQTGWEEGILVRWILRTTEFCRELQSIFETIGNEELCEKCKEIEAQIQRNMIATRSIYW
jgi:superfamily II RNA helicase